MTNKLHNEKATVRGLRLQGFTLQEIADHYQKSISWVYSRVSERYSPKKSSPEEQFKQNVVIPTLRNMGHIIISTSTKPFEELKVTHRPDIISIFQDEIYITEVKLPTNQHNILTGIGQLIWTRLENSFVKLQLALPEGTDISGEIITKIKATEDITILLM